MTTTPSTMQRTGSCVCRKIRFTVTRSFRATAVTWLPQVPDTRPTGAGR
ncbi:hypothetical protein [Streptomyces sp. SPB4]|nr:hypothetical protein [Streptomyces sp. SPB4]MDH6544846.1 hypothetical protein [Streptomyces sp. SPB4]